MKTPLETFRAANGLTVEIHPDTCPDSPRGWANLGKLASIGRACLASADEHFSTERDLENALIARAVNLGNIDADDLPEHHRAAILAKYWLIDSGNSPGQMRGSYSLVLSTEHAKKEFSGASDWREKASRCLAQEAATFNAYVEGDVFGYVIKDDEGHDLDSCWGFYGFDDVRTQATEAALSINPAALVLGL